MGGSYLAYQNGKHTMYPLEFGYNSIKYDGNIILKNIGNLNEVDLNKIDLNNLIKENSRLIWKMINKYGGDVFEEFWDVFSYDYDDIFQEAAIVFIETFKDFDPSISSFSNWFGVKIKDYFYRKKRSAVTIMRGGQGQNNQKHYYGIKHERLDREIGADLKLIDVLSNLFSCNNVAEFENELIRKMELKRRVHKLLSMLDENEKIILKQWFRELTREEAAEELNVDVYYIRRYRQRIKNKAKKVPRSV